ncbi:ABC transporter ATP-binding protein [Streptomyces sp. NPDC000594]|uniref:ABC transporter ATP-binding protein n=1 Tax=Streptomyces sp. NPDC000594 TaxID=3154261 RepID=UPI00331F5D03
MNRPSPAPAGTLPSATPRRARRETARRLARRRGRLTATALVLVCGTAVTLTAPLLLGAIVDAVTTGAGNGRITALGALLVLVSLTGAALTLAGGRMLAGLVQDTLAGLREEVFEAAVQLPAETLESGGSSDVVSRVTGDVEAISEAASGVLPQLTGALLTIGLTLAGLAVLDPRLALAGLVCVPVQWYAARRFLARSHLVYGDVRRLEAERGQTVIEAVRGAETIRAYRAQEHHLGDLADRSLRAVDRQRDGVRLANRFYGGLHIAEFLGMSAILVMGFALLESGAITLGAATAAALYFHRLFGPIGALLTGLDDIQRATVGLGRLIGVTDLGADRARPVAPAGGPGAAGKPGAAGRPGAAPPSVEVSGVTFTHPGATRPALRGVSLSVPGGTTVALVGASGSGKSTLARLIAGIGRPDEGRVTVGGDDAHRAPGAYLVTQETHLFGGTLADNLTLAAPDATRAALEHALAESGAVRALPPGTGLDTVLGGADGVGLDGGAVQHLALARVLPADPPLLILDEPTAESGPATPALLTEALRRVTRGRTGVIVAHRLEQARDADLVVLLQDGRVAEQGTHEHLLSREGEYATLWRAYTQGHRAPARTHRMNPPRSMES